MTDSQALINLQRQIDAEGTKSAIELIILYVNESAWKDGVCVNQFAEHLAEKAADEWKKMRAA